MPNLDHRQSLVSFKINGEIFDVGGEVEYVLSGAKREGIPVSAGEPGYKETQVIPGMKVTVLDRRGLDLRKVMDLTDSTIIAQKGNGKGVMARGAWYSGDRTASVLSGEVPLEFQCRSCEEY